MYMQKGKLLRIKTKAYEQIDFSLDYLLRIDCLR